MRSLRFLPAALYVLALATFLIASPHAQAEDWQPTIDLRYRLEWVDDDRFRDDAVASTLRLRAGIVSPEFSGWRFGLTGHANRHLASDRFNSTANGRSRYPVVGDPDDEAISEAWVGYSLPGQLSVKLGRQRINEDNQRFIGNVGFRQLEQTFDAISLSLTPAAGWQADLRWLDKAHRVFGRSNPSRLNARADLDAWMATVQRDFGDHQLAVYGHHLEFRDRVASHRNLGARLTGRLPGELALNYRLEYARQEGIREQRTAGGQNYIHLRLAGQLEQWHWFAGHERLGGNGHYAVQTPLATLHAHNGWTDQFLTTPAAGLLDTHAAIGARFGPWNSLVKLHDFRADSTSLRYGRELGVMISRPLVAGLSAELKAAWFDAARGGADVHKLWFTLSGSW